MVSVGRQCPQIISNENDRIVKKWYILPAVAILLFLTSAAGNQRAGAAVGDEVPYLEVKNDVKRISLSAERGKYVVLNFWSTKDAQSRIDNALFDRALASGSHRDVAFISVCMDEDTDLWRQILKIDGLNVDCQFEVNDSRLPGIAEDFSVQSACRSYVISPEGKIIAAGLDAAGTLATLPV